MTQKAETRKHKIPGPERIAQSLDKDLQEKRAGKAKIPRQTKQHHHWRNRETYRDAKDADAQVHGVGLDPKCCEILEQRPEEDSKVSREKDMRDEGPVSQQCGPTRRPTCLQINVSVRPEMASTPLRLERKHWSRDDQ